MTTGMRNIRKVLYWMVVADLFLVAIGLRQGVHWLISSQVAFASSLLATLASFYAYKRLVDRRIKTGDIPQEPRDELDTIEDRYELYDDEAQHADHAKSATTEDLRSVIREERQKIGGIKTGMQNAARSFSALISPLRIAAYLVLVLGFLYLNRHEMLEIWGYVSGLAIVPLVALLVGSAAARHSSM